MAESIEYWPWRREVFSSIPMNVSVTGDQLSPTKDKILQMIDFNRSQISLGQGNVFTSLTHSVHWGRVSEYDVTSCLVDWSHVPSGGYLYLVPCSF